MNPLLIGTILVMGLILVLDIEVAVFQKSAQVLSDLLTLATICLAVPVYRQFKILRENSWVVLISCLALASSKESPMFNGPTITSSKTVFLKIWSSGF